jgi:hypothetical protein
MPGSNWWVDSFPASVPGGTTYGGGGGYGSTDALTARDPLDAKRMAAGFAPGASYPDGYLGNITDRHEDKVLGALQTRLSSSTSYQRGVHKGEIAGPQAYFWNEDMDPQMGLARQAEAIPADVEGGVVFMTPKFTPTGNPVEMLAHDGVIPTLPAREQERRARAMGVDTAMNPVTVTDPSRAARMQQDLPRWSGVFQA